MKVAYWICQQEKKVEKVGASIIDYKVFFKCLFLGRQETVDYFCFNILLK